VANSNINTVSVIDTATNIVTATVNVGVNPDRIVVSPDGKKVYVVNSADGTISVIDTATNTVTAIVSVGQDVGAVTFSSDGSQIYVLKGNFFSNEGTVSIIDAATNVVKTTVNLGSLPNQIAIGNVPHKAPADFNYLIIASMVVLYIRKKLS
jgi:YVTN family beta-propeller protein